jgi:hypothetical protein
VPVELGGSRNIANLAAEAAPGFRAKNRLEKQLRKLVCAGRMRLGLAQRSIASSWPTLYRRVFGRAP